MPQNNQTTLYALSKGKQNMAENNQKTRDAVKTDKEELHIKCIK